MIEDIIKNINEVGIPVALNSFESNSETVIIPSVTYMSVPGPTIFVDNYSYSFCDIYLFMLKTSEKDEKKESILENLFVNKKIVYTKVDEGKEDNYYNVEYKIVIMRKEN